MGLFQSPPPTRYDLHFNIAGFPVRVHPLFWVMTIILGSSSSDFIYILIWVVVVFISILVHELGHAIAMRVSGQPSHIVLYFGGGLTVSESVSWGRGRANIALSRNQEILISLAGPVAGFLFAGFLTAGVAVMGGTVSTTTLFGIGPLPEFGRVVNLIVVTFLWVNIFWGLINLVPVFPLDGGNIARNVLVQVDPLDGVRKSLWLSVIAGAVVAGAGLLLLGSIYIALLFGFLAFRSYQSLQGYTGSRF